MELFSDIVKERNSFTNFAKIYILDVWQGHECAFEEVGDLFKSQIRDIV